MINIYDKMREQARAIGHAAANLPDTAWQNHLEKQREKTRLTEAKMYMEHYMMGNLEPSEFAQVMAENNELRYAISDICRMRLEPTDFGSLHHNGDYIDLKAGVKTFWTEIRVPLPSERDAARDISNINAGIRAERRMNRQNQQNHTVRDEGEKIPFRDKLRQARQAAAGKAIEFLTPLAEEPAKTPEKTPITESWMKTPEGHSYKSHYTHDAARQIENVAMTIEAAKDQTLDPAQRKRAFEAAGLSESTIRQQMSDADLKEAREKAHSLRSGYSMEELNRPLNDQLQELFDQIALHAGQERTAKQEVPEQKTSAKAEVPKADMNKETNRIHGMFEGQKVSFNGNAFGHRFTDEEAAKLLAGEDVSFTYADRSGRSKTMVGNLQWQEFNGKTYLGFKADFDKVNALAKGAPLKDDGAMDYYTQMADDVGADLAEKIREIPLEIPDEGLSL